MLELFPLDTFVERTVMLMQTVDGSVPEIWSGYSEIIQSGPEAKAYAGFEMVERFAFYESAKSCYAVVATGESKLYANIILKKGVVV